MFNYNYSDNIRHSTNLILPRKMILSMDGQHITFTVTLAKFRGSFSFRSFVFGIYISAKVKASLGLDICKQINNHDEDNVTMPFKEEGIFHNANALKS